MNRKGALEYDINARKRKIQQLEDENDHDLAEIEAIEQAEAIKPKEAPNATV